MAVDNSVNSVNNYRQAFKSSIARLYHTNGAVVGAGFLVDDRLLLTCAHVVTAALGVPLTTSEAPTDVIDLDFPLIAPDLKIKARVVFWSPVDPLQKKIGEDMAGLVLESQPLHSQPVRFVQGNGVWNHPFHIFGFPSQRDVGIWASGVLRDRLANGWVQVEDVKAEGYAVEPGFSGAPVWDEQLDGVVGMAIAAERKRSDAKAAFMIPVSVLSSTWADLAHRAVGSQPQACGSSTLPSFRQVKLKAKQEYLSVQMKKYEAAYNQLSYTLSQAEAVAIRRHVQTLEQEIIQIEQEIQELINL